MTSDNGGALDPADIEAAARRLAPHVRTTPTMHVAGSEIGVDAELVLKLEFLQHSGSFKARGATNALLTRPVAPEGVVAASGGNHGAAIAWAAQRFGHVANIFVPTVAAPAKVERLTGYGARVHRVGDVYADALAAADAFCEAHDVTTVHAYDDPVVMAGAGTCARELESQAGGLDALLLACGGGGLSGGAASWLGDRVEVVACETPGTSTYAAALRHGGPVDVTISGVASDALGATRLGSWPWQALASAGATSVVVPDEAVLAARQLLWDWLRVVVEPAAAAPIAALTEGAWMPGGRRIGVVLCGANTDAVSPPPPARPG